MAHGKDIAWTQIGFVGGAAVLGLLAGIFIAAPMLQKMKDKKKTTALAAKKTAVLKKTA